MLQGNFNQLRNYMSTPFNIVTRNQTRFHMAPVRPVNRPTNHRVPLIRRNPNAAPPRQQPQPQQRGNRQAHQQGQQQQPPPRPPPPPFQDYYDPTAKLGKAKSLLELWNEYLHGLRGNKPAKDFTAAERGRLKTNYSRRNAFWEVMCALVNRGHTELEAIALLKQSYGQTLSVTGMCNALVRARRNGYHVNLNLPRRLNLRGGRRVLVDV